MPDERGSAKVIGEIVKLGARISVADMTKIGVQAEAAGGSLTSVDPDGDWCGTGRIHVKWPPKRNEFAALLDSLVASRINFEVLINGIPVPDGVIINVSRKMRFQ